MSIKQTGPRLWTIRVQWRDEKTGRKRSMTEEFEGTERAAKSRREQMRADARKRGARKQRQKLGPFALSWMQRRIGMVKPSVSHRYAIALDNHIIPALGDFWLDRIDHTDVQAYVAKRTADGAQGHTVMNELRLLRTMAKDAKADGLSPENWTERVTPPKVRKWTEERPNLFTAAQLGQVLAAVPKRWLPMVTLSAFTGLRWGELSALRWSDVDEEAGAIRVRRSNWRGRMGAPKTDGSHRTVPLPPEVAELLASGRRGRSDALLFPNGKGEPYKSWPLVAVMRKACKAAGVPYATPHGLRRTFNNLARQVAAAQVVKSITGHTTDAMLEHYSMIGLDEKADAARLVMALVQGQKSSEPPPSESPEFGAGAEREGDRE